MELEENQNQAPEKKSSGFAIASLVLGIIALILCCIWYISIPCAVLSIIFCIVSKKSGPNGMATAGLILSIIALIIAILFVILIILGLTTAMVGNV